VTRDLPDQKRGRLPQAFDGPFPGESEGPGYEPHNELINLISVAARDLVLKRDAWLNPTQATTEELQALTLTTLYNNNPQWLQDSHGALDEAVLAAYGWPHNVSDTEILERLLTLNQERANVSKTAPKGRRSLHLGYKVEPDSGFFSFRIELLPAA
jgi:hypothetical protein